MSNAEIKESVMAGEALEEPAVKNVTVEEIKKTIRAVIGELTELDTDSLDENSLLIEELGLNSITIVQIFLSCQDTYDIVLASEMNLAEPMSISSLAETVLNKISA